MGTGQSYSKVIRTDKKYHEVISMKISIIIPIYNVSQYVERCLTSVINQTTQETIECICVDDCGTDNSMEIVENFVKKSNNKVIKFKLLYHKTNKGLSGARNTGIKNATGDYIYLLDSDDEITPTCMENFNRIISEHPKVDLVQGLFEQDTPYMKQFVHKSFPNYTEDRKYIKKALLDYNEIPICSANKLIRRELLIENQLFFKEGIIHEDNYFSFFLAKHVKSLAINAEKCYIYFVNPNSIMTAPLKEKEIISYQAMIEDFSNNLDSYLINQQKTIILYLLNKAICSHFYNGERQKYHLFKCLYVHCSFTEKMFMRLWYKKPTDRKLFHLLLHIVNI